MSKKNQNISITRDLKIDENSKMNKYSDIPLNSVTQKFMKEPITLEALDKKFKHMNETSKNKENEIEENIPKKKSRKAEEKAIFYDIFVKPKENKIKEIIEKRNQKKKDLAVTIPQIKNKIYISNKVTIDGKIVGMNQLTSTQTNFNFPGANEKIDEKLKEKSLKKKTFKNEEILEENISKSLENKNVDIHILNNFLHEKYILSKFSPDTSKKNYFNQLIQIRPPEGINAVVASPLMDSKGWAPSIPSVNIEKLNTNLKDLMIRAKGGIKAGDITKEAHMAFYLGIMNEEEKKYENALKFYKKYFLSAKLLQDIYGTELALNRIAVLFSNIYDYNQSIYYNEKHKEITTHNLNGFVAYYNCGVCYRILENFEESIKNFEKALKMSEEENDLESYTLCLAQLAISFIFMGNVDDFIEYSQEFFNKNKSLGHGEMELEMEILSGFILNFCGKLDNSKEFYERGLNKSREIGNERYKAISLCNMGIIEADKDIESFIENLNKEQEEYIKNTENEENEELNTQNEQQSGNVEDENQANEEEKNEE